MIAILQDFRWSPCNGVTSTATGYSPDPTRGGQGGQGGRGVFAHTRTRNIFLLLYTSLLFYLSIFYFSVLCVCNFTMTTLTTMTKLVNTGGLAGHSGGHGSDEGDQMEVLS